MTDFYSVPALDSELDYRRRALRRAAAEHRLARQARRGTRTGRDPHTEGRRTAR